MAPVRLIPILRRSIFERPHLQHFLSWLRMRVNETQKCAFFACIWIGRCKNRAPAANPRIMGIKLRTPTFATFSKLPSLARKSDAKIAPRRRFALFPGATFARYFAACSGSTSLARKCAAEIARRWQFGALLRSIFERYFAVLAELPPLARKIDGGIAPPLQFAIFCGSMTERYMSQYRLDCHWLRENTRGE